jgi:hypothetical protein
MPAAAQNYASQWPADRARGANCECDSVSACAALLHTDPGAVATNGTLELQVRRWQEAWSR